MREVLFLALFGCIAVLCPDTNALQEPYFGSGSGDEEPSVVTSTGTSISTKPTLGDDEDFGSGSATPEASTVHNLTTVAQSTTRQTSTKTTAQPSTTERTTTVEHITTTWTASKTGVDDFSGSGSASGSGADVLNDPMEMSTKPTSSDFIIDVSTTDNTVIIERRPTAPEDAKFPSTSSPETTQSFKNTKMPSTASSIPWKLAKQATTKRASTRVESTEHTDLTTEILTQKTVKPSAGLPEHTTEFEEESTGRPTEVYDFTTEKSGDTTKKSQGTTKKGKGTSTTSNANAMANRGNKQEEGFTLTTEVIAGVVACALLALLLIAFLMYRLKKRDEGSYLLDDSNAYPSDYKKLHLSDKEAFI